MCVQLSHNEVWCLKHISWDEIASPGDRHQSITRSKTSEMHLIRLAQRDMHIKKCTSNVGESGQSD